MLLNLVNRITKEVYGEIMADRFLSEEEACDLLGYEIAQTQEDYDYNEGMLHYDEIEVVKVEEEPQ